MTTRALSPVTHEDSMKKMGIITDRVVNVGGFAEPLPTMFTTDEHRFVNTLAAFMTRLLFP
jgi:hypothetical protein